MARHGRTRRAPFRVVVVSQTDRVIGRLKFLWRNLSRLLACGIRPVRWESVFGRSLPAGFRTSRSPSPRPPPLGRGSPDAQRSSGRAVSDPPGDWHRFSLSLGERAGVRGNRARDQKRLQNLILAVLVTFLTAGCNREASNEV